MPEVSIVLPVFNENNKYLSQCLLSIQEQTLQNWECIIILESKLDDNEQLIKQFSASDPRFQVVRPKLRLGLSASLNVGVQLAQSEFVARMDSDDIMDKERLLEQLRFMKRNKNVSVVGSYYSKINSSGDVMGIRRYPLSGFYLSLYFAFRCGLAHPTVMFRKKDFEVVGGYNEDLKYCEDLDLWLRYMRIGFKLENVNKVLMRYRISGRTPSHWAQMLRLRCVHLWRTCFIRRKNNG